MLFKTSIDPNLKQIDKEIYRISKKIKILSAILPVNLVQEKREFFDAHFNYNPQFRYRKLKFSTKNLKRSLKKLEKKLSGFDLKEGEAIIKIFKNKVLELRKELEFLENIGRENFAKRSIALYGKPAQRLISHALKHIKDLKIKKEFLVTQPVTSGKAKQKIKKLLLKRRLNWKIKEYKKLASRIAVDPKTKTIKLRKGVLFKDGCLKCVIAHEIETHIERFENAGRLPFKIFRIGTAGYLPTEEGLAIYNERRVHQNRGESYHYQRIYLRALGVYWALKYSFQEVFDKFLSLDLDPETSWEFTVRVKRGLRDTSRPGGFTKDYLYLKGYLDIKKFIKFGGRINDLYIGKVSFEDLSHLKGKGFTGPDVLTQYPGNKRKQTILAKPR